MPQWVTLQQRWLLLRWAGEDNEGLRVARCPVVWRQTRNALRCAGVSMASLWVVATAGVVVFELVEALAEREAAAVVSETATTREMQPKCRVQDQRASSVMSPSRPVL